MAMECAIHLCDSLGRANRQTEGGSGVPGLGHAGVVLGVPVMGCGPPPGGEVGLELGGGAGCSTL